VKFLAGYSCGPKSKGGGDEPQAGAALRSKGDHAVACQTAGGAHAGRRGVSRGLRVRRGAGNPHLLGCGPREHGVVGDAVLFNSVQQVQEVPRVAKTRYIREGTLRPRFVPCVTRVWSPVCFAGHLLPFG
jgi:hypothetical protein